MATIKQKKAVKKIIENHGNVSKGMEEAGYEKNTAHNPKNLTNSKGWQELMKEHLSDKKLSKVHDEGLKAERDGKADHPTRHKYLDTAYKLKGKYAPEKVELEVDEKVDKDSKEYKEYILWRKKQ